MPQYTGVLQPYICVGQSVQHHGMAYLATVLTSIEQDTCTADPVWTKTAAASMHSICSTTPLTVTWSPRWTLNVQDLLVQGGYF